MRSELPILQEDPLTENPPWCNKGLPSMRDSLTNPIHVYEGDDALITCVVRDIGKNTVMWKKEDRERHSMRVLTAGETRVTADKRFGVLHDSVEALTEKSLSVSWSLPVSNLESVREYNVNVTSLKTFDDRVLEPVGSNKTSTRQTISVKVPIGQNSTVLNNLMPFTMYEQTNVAPAPQLPDIKACCANKGIGHKTCVNKLCDPSETKSVEITDLMICAPWAADTFSCLTNGLDHTPCCRARGLPDICQELCTGNVSSIDFNYFKCLRYMGEYTNCLLQGYGVLPSAPTQVHITNIETEFAILHWSPPKTLGDTVQHYNVHIRSFTEEESEYMDIPKVQSPYVLENLESDTDYEVYIEAVNTHGTGSPSSRLTFRTESRRLHNKFTETNVGWDVLNVFLQLDFHN
ncbi:unnamed protein product [Brassicogethes aeneus]|uniref:Uncharacterized protein n=1 Tax=Brassicogethes aeneus TaxID=1431903 RepID=A0A9P0BK14_BRAAE|nr:unnamed protein product [Brassicogethes aeneus]